MSKIYGKIVQLRKKIGAVARDQQGKGLTYKFRGYEALFLAARPAMDELGLCLETHFSPLNEDTTYSFTAHDGKTKTGTMCAGTFAVKVVDSEDGSFVTYEAPYVALDTSDKAAGKAASYAMKTALFTGLMIPSEDLPEHDAERPEVPSKAAMRGTKTAEQVAAQLSKLPKEAWPDQLIRCEQSRGVEFTNEVKALLG